MNDQSRNDLCLVLLIKINLFTQQDLGNMKRMIQCSGDSVRLFMRTTRGGDRYWCLQFLRENVSSIQSRWAKFKVKFIKILLFVFRFYSHYLWQLKPQGGVVLLHIFASVWNELNVGNEYEQFLKVLFWRWIASRQVFWLASVEALAC